jgi:hypothetical protein
MNRRRVGEDRGSKETDGCPLTITATYLCHFSALLEMELARTLWKSFL